MMEKNCTYTCVYYYLLTITRLTPKIFWLKYFIKAKLWSRVENDKKKKRARTASQTSFSAIV